jgi:pimeloyl-ACP methyl ester carboxylesterase
MRGSVLNDPLLNGRYFFPRPARFPAPLWVQADGAELACAFHPVEGADLTVVHFHGNGEVVRDWLEEGFPQRFEALGCSLLLAEYRGYGMSSGQPALGRMLDDAVKVIEAADLPPERLVLFGRSVGSIFAIHAASRFPDVAGLILESAIADPLERLLLRLDPSELDLTPAAFAEEVRAQLDHRRKMAAYPGPVLVLHARFDDLVPVTHGERLAEWATGPTTVRLFERGHHNTVLAENDAAYFEAIAGFLREVRRGRREEGNRPGA